MTKEEVISEWTFRSNHIKKWLEECGETPSVRHYVELIDMTIEILSAEVEAAQSVGRYENAMQKLQEMPKYLNGIKAKQINKISSGAAQGEWIKHKGKWIDFDFYPTKYECNQCHYYVDEGYDSIFCPNCGARMKGGEDE